MGSAFISFRLVHRGEPSTFSVAQSCVDEEGTLPAAAESRATGTSSRTFSIYTRKGYQSPPFFFLLLTRQITGPSSTSGFSAFVFFSTS